MLELKNIKKDYEMGEEKVHALKGINLKFRNSEFVSILGSSGCGKTTLLNIIGGLDKYTSGDLIVNSESTKDFKDSDWDYYRNYSVGFVFQSYNLIPHQTVLSNVEMALTISGYSKEEKRKKAIKALKDVGLSDHINKKPNQLSGGQMQRVAIARAIVNDPDIILADEPTGALDTETSIQIMNLLKKISKDKLIIMVTHNPELAEKYSTRIVKLVDGKVTSDTNPVKENEKVKTKKDFKLKNKKTQMSFKTAFGLSLNNLMTKKGRTFLTAFAGSVGIIGIALILSLSSGMQNYINKVEEDTLSSYPITIENESIDMSSLMETMMNEKDNNEDYDDNKVHSKNIMFDMISSLSNQSKSNNLTKFKEYLENEDSTIKDNSNAIKYSYDLNLNLYKMNDDGTYFQTNPNQVMSSFGEYGSTFESNKSLMGSSSIVSTDIWTELLDNSKLLESQYDVLAGRMPEKYNEVVLILDENNQISDYTLYALGLKDTEELSEIFKNVMDGEKVETTDSETYSYDDFLNLKFKILLNSDYFIKENGIWIDKSSDTNYITSKLKDATDINIVGIIKPNEESNITSASYGEIGYLHSLTEYVIKEVNNSDIAKEQLADENVNVFTGTKFEENNDFDISSLTDEQKKELSSMSQTEQIEYISALTENMGSTYEDNLAKIGVIDLNNPSSISIYPSDFDSKETIKTAIADYNANQDNDEDKIEYSDLVGTMMTSVTKIVNIISYVLIAFVSISLIVSSIMIAIITYISVLERTKEIGILRAMGTAKKDISKIFNAETFIEGLLSGTLGILITLIINIPINLIIKHLLGVSNIASLPLGGAIALIIISILLNVFAGLIPAKIASKKDPAVVLRSE
jgi:putative ABC transport system permease protein